MKTLHSQYNALRHLTYTAWKVSKYGPEIILYLDTFHAVILYYKQNYCKDIQIYTIFGTHKG